MGKNRDRVEIMADVLKAAGNGANKTKIMFMANLSYKLLEKYLDAVMRVGFVQALGSRYKMTEEGRMFLSRYQSFFYKHNEAQKTLSNLADERLCLEKLTREKSLDFEVT